MARVYAYDNKGVFMARITKSLMTISGKFGDAVFRNVNGNSYLVSAPKKRGPLTDAKSVMLRRKFVLCEKISASVRKIPALLLMWSAFAGSAKAKKEIFKHVYWQLNAEDASGVKMLPASDFNFTMNSTGYNDGIISISAFIDSAAGISAGINPYVTLHASLILFSDTEVLKERYRYCSLSSSEMKTNAGSGILFQLKLSDVQQVMFAECSKAVLLMALVTADKNKSPVKGSETIAVYLK